jgi:glycosyltransferase involved in cell wall biosynthesis
VRHYLVDNASTDGTRERVDRFLASHDGFPLTILEEDQKGTGAASDTGFRPRHRRRIPADWPDRRRQRPPPRLDPQDRGRFAARPGLALLGGRSVPLDDAYRRAVDPLAIPAASVILRSALTAAHRDPVYLRMVAGHNLATRATAYEEAGGFPRSSIEERDEDIEYLLRIARTFGRGPSPSIRTLWWRPRCAGSAPTGSGAPPFTTCCRACAEGSPGTRTSGRRLPPGGASPRGRVKTFRPPGTPPLPRVCWFDGR